MAIANATTTVSVDKTIGEIYALLRRAGADNISTDYQQGEPVSVSFRVKTRHGLLAYRLPANIAGMHAALKADYNEGRLPLRYTKVEHARMVAWRVIKDWLRAQLAIVESQMVSVDEVMLPYMQVEDGRTVYQAVVDAEMRVALPPAPNVIALPAPRVG